MMGTADVDEATTVLARQVDDDVDPLADDANRPLPMTLPARDTDAAATPPTPPCVKVGAAAAVTTPNARRPDEGIAPTTTRKALVLPDPPLLRTDAEINAR